MVAVVPIIGRDKEYFSTSGMRSEDDDWLVVNASRNFAGCHLMFVLDQAVRLVAQERQ